VLVEGRCRCPAASWSDTLPSCPSFMRVLAHRRPMRRRFARGPPPMRTRNGVCDVVVIHDPRGFNALPLPLYCKELVGAPAGASLYPPLSAGNGDPRWVVDRRRHRIPPFSSRMAAGPRAKPAASSASGARGLAERGHEAGCPDRTLPDSDTGLDISRNVLLPWPMSWSCQRDPRTAASTVHTSLIQTIDCTGVRHATSLLHRRNPTSYSLIGITTATLRPAPPLDRVEFR